MKQIFIFLAALMISQNIWADFSRQDRQSHPNAASLITVQGQAVRTRNLEGEEIIFGKHQTYFYPAPPERVMNVVIEIRVNQKPAVRTLWQVACGKQQNHLAVLLAIANFAKNELYDTKRGFTLAQLLDKPPADFFSPGRLDYDEALIQGKRPAIQDACRLAMKK